MKNNGSSGMDSMQRTGPEKFIDQHWKAELTDILKRRQVPKAIKGVEIPKSTVKIRLLGLPCVVDRWLQEAICRHLATSLTLVILFHL